MKYLILTTICLASVIFVFADSNDLPNLYEPRYQVYTAGQPTEDGFQQLEAMGVKTVINVLPEQECLPGEMLMVTDHKMNYIAVPFSTTVFNRKTIEQFAMVLKAQGKQPVLIHCSTGNHVGGMWFAYRVLIDKASLPTALKEARKIGLQPELENALFNWVVAESEKMLIEESNRAS